MYIKSLSVYGSSNKLLYHRAYELVPKEVLRSFENKYLATGDYDLLGPLFMVDNELIVTVKEGGIKLVAIPSNYAQIMLIMTFLSNLSQLVRSYIGSELDDTTYTHYFFVAAEIIEESIILGRMELVNEIFLNDLLRLNMKKRHTDAEEMELTKEMTSRATGAVPWRSPGLRYANNEVCVDVQEKLNLIVSKNGTELKQEVHGVIVFKSRLGGMPECRFGTNDLGGLTSLPLSTNSSTKSIISFENVNFHRCVQLNKYQHNNSIVFIPPEGSFVLMSYRTLRSASCFLVTPSYSTIVLDQKTGQSGLKVCVKMVCTIPEIRCARNVVVTIPVNPEYSQLCRLETERGKATYYEGRNQIIWRTKQIQGHQNVELTAQLRSVGVVSDVAPDPRPVTLDFCIPGFAASGISIRYLRVVEKSGYKAVKWLRYITRAGTVEFRR